MPEAVLAGVDPRQPAIDALTGQPLTIEELLRRRGILATGGNSRMMPLEMPVAAPVTPGVAASVASASGAGGSAAAPAGIVATPEQEAESEALAQRLGMQGVEADDNFDWITPLLAGGTVAGGSLLAAGLLNRKRGDKPSARQDLAASSNTDGAAAANSSYKVNNTEETVPYYPVADNQVATTIADRKRLRAGNNNRTSAAGPAGLNSATEVTDPSGLPKPSAGLPSRGPRALPDYSATGRPNTRQEIGARQAVQSRVLPDAPPMQSGDAYSDIPDNVMQDIRSVAMELAKRRAAGRANKVSGRAGKPTAEPDVPSIVNELARRWRENPTITRMITRVH